MRRQAQVHAERTLSGAVRWAAVGLTVGGLAGAAAAIPWATWEPYPVVVLSSRTVEHLLPPWGYDTDRMHLQDLVVEMLCPDPRPSLPDHTRRYRSFASKCAVAPDADETPAVEVLLPPDRRWTGSGERVDAASVRDALIALAPHLLRSQPTPTWSTIEVVSPLRLKVVPPEGILAEELLQDLAGVALARACEGSSERGGGVGPRDRDCVEGTGPYAMVDPLAERLEGGGVPGEELLPPALREVARDELHLRRCEPRWPLPELCQDLHFFGIPTSGFLTPARAVDSARVDALARGLEARPAPWELQARGREGGAPPVALVPDAEYLVMRALEDARKRPGSQVDRWVLSSRADLRVLLAVIRPSSAPLSVPSTCPSPARLDPATRQALREGLATVAGDSAFLQAVGGVAATSMVPTVLKPPLVAFPAPAVPGASAEGGPGDGRYALLTNSAWKDAGERLTKGREFLVLAAPAPTEEARCRRAGAYDVSLLSVGASSSPTVASFLVGSLSAWFGDPATSLAPGGVAADQLPDLADLEPEPDGSYPRLMRYARAVLRREQQGRDVVSEVEALLSAVNQSVVPMASLRRSFAYHDGLRGWDAERQAFLPDELARGDDPRPPGWPGLALLLGGTFMGVVYGLSRGAQERDARRMAVQVRGFHHELSRALSSVYAGLEALPEGMNRQRLERQLEEGMDLVDAVGLSVLGDAWTLEVRGTSSWVEVLPPLIEEIEQAARRDGVRLVLEAEVGPGSNQRVPLPPQFLRRLALNLLENALKYREGDAAIIRISARAVGPWVALYVEDQGIGVRTQPERAFELGWRTPEAAQRAGGLGVGLAFVRAVAERVGGRAWLVSSHKPTLFEVILPPVDDRRAAGKGT